MAKESRTRQQHVEDAIVDVMPVGSILSTADINTAVKRALPPTPADDVRANRRENETKFDQVISNALEAKRRLCRDGLVERTAEGHFCFTAKGEADKMRRHQDLVDSEAIFQQVCPDGLA